MKDVGGAHYISLGLPFFHGLIALKLISTLEPRKGCKIINKFKLAEDEDSVT